MDKATIDRYKQWFTQFVAGYYVSADDYLNQNIQLKECHTRRVCKEMRLLSKALELNESDTLLAETIALFHDVGRFPQFQQYRTYKDAISENHCLMALSVLQKHQVLIDVPDDERSIIEKAIRFHGDKELPPMDERTQHFSKMIRDADKIDIFELLSKNYAILADDPENFPWELEYPDTPECNPVILQAIMNQDLIDYRELRTLNDAKLLQLGWVYDVYFDWTLKQIYDRGYLMAIIDLLPQTEDINEATGCILSYVQRRLNRLS